MIFETHAHYDDERYDEDREELLAGLRRQNVGYIVNVGADIDTSRQSVALAEKWDYIYASVGVHPDEVECLEREGLNPIEELARKSDRVVAIGEIGLDYFRKEADSYAATQKKWFIEQLELAHRLDMPVIIHSRDAARDTMDILKSYRKSYAQTENPGVVHCYSYSPEIAREYVDMGFYIGIGGVLTFKNAKKLVSTVGEIPLESILVETDSPYMAPEPHRGERNNSAYIAYVIDRIAEIKGVSAELVEEITEQNARRMYGV